MEQKIKWYSETQYVDIDTGELLKKSEVERGHYRKIKTTKQYEFNESNGIRYGTIKHTTEIREHEQQRIGFD